MAIAAGCSAQPDFSQALAEACQPIREAFAAAPPDLTFVFVSHHHAAHFGEIGPAIREQTGTRLLLGCTGEAIIGGEQELENQPALSVWSAALPGSVLTTFAVEFEETPDGMVCSGVPEGLGEHLSETRAILMVAEPYSSIPTSLLDVFGDELPGVPVIGGMASGGGPGANRLFLNEYAVETGAIGVVLRGGPQVQTIVSQGCRPIGQPYVVTRADRNIIFELGGKTALERLQEMFPGLSARDQQLFEQGVFLGVAMSEYRDTFQRGDFLISNVLGADRDTGAVAISNLVRLGQTVQFHLRDAATADEDLTQLLDQFQQSEPARAAGGLLFTCNGRGTRMFPEPNHDAGVVQNLLGPLPLAGMFAQGELGPVSGKNYIHGFTASLALFMVEEPA